MNINPKRSEVNRQRKRSIFENHFGGYPRSTLRGRDLSLNLKNIPAKSTIGDQIIYSHYPSMPRFLHFSVPTARPSQPRFYDTRRIFHPLPPVPCPHRSPEFTTDFVSTLLQPAAVQGGRQKQPREEVSDLASLNQITDRRTFPR